MGNVFSDVVYIPYAVSVEGQIIRVFDPSSTCRSARQPVSDEHGQFIPAP